MPPAVWTRWQISISDSMKVDTMTFDSQSGDHDHTADDAPDHDIYREAIREASGVAIRSACIWLPIAGAILVAGLYAQQKPLIAADEILADKAADYWQEAFMPAILFGFFGAAYGLFLGWRTTSACGMVGWPAWIIGAAATFALALIGIVGSLLIYPGAIPMMLWISLALMIVASLGGVSYFTLWTG